MTALEGSTEGAHRDKESAGAVEAVEGGGDGCEELGEMRRRFCGTQTPTPTRLLRCEDERGGLRG